MKHSLSLGVVSLLGLLACIGLCLASCTPRAPVDTDGDGRPDRQMSEVELDRWEARRLTQLEEAAKAEEAARLAEAERIAQDTQREQERIAAEAKRQADQVVRATARAISQLDVTHAHQVDELRAEAEEQLDRLEASQVQLASDAIAKGTQAIEDLRRRIVEQQQTIRSQISSVRDEAASGRERIAEQTAVWGVIGDVATGVAPSVDSWLFPAAATGLLTHVVGLLFGRKAGERAAHERAEIARTREREEWDLSEANAKLNAQQAAILALNAQLAQMVGRGLAPAAQPASGGVS